MTARVNIASSLAFILAFAGMSVAGQAAFAQTAPNPQTPSTDSTQSGTQHKHHHKKQQDTTGTDQTSKPQ